MKRLWQLFYTLLAVCTSMVGYRIHGSVFWSICDFFFYPLAWIKWLICQQVSLRIIKATFAFFLT